MRPYTSGGWDKDHVPNGRTGPFTGSNYGFYVPHDRRGFFDFGTGALGDAGIHALGPANQALQLGLPISVECIRAEQRSSFSYPARSVLRFDFPARGEMAPVSVYWYDGGRNGNPANFYHPEGLENEVLLPCEENLAALGRPDIGSAEAWNGKHPVGSYKAVPMGAGGGNHPELGVLMHDGAIFKGEKGYLATVSRGEGVQLLPAKRWEEYTLPEPVLPRSPGHYRDWLRACKGGAPACSNFSVAGPFAEWVTLGAIAQRVAGKLAYEATTRSFTNSAEANGLLKPAFRKGWELKL